MTKLTVNNNNNNNNNEKVNYLDNNNDDRTVFLFIKTYSVSMKTITKTRRKFGYWFGGVDAMARRYSKTSL